MMRSMTRRYRQRGFTLVELLVSVAISLIVVSGMVLMMSTTIGATTDTIRATRLSNELRASMQILIRDLRRVNFDENFANCIGIGPTVCDAAYGKTLTTDTFNIDGSCVSYQYRRASSTRQGVIRLNGDVLQFNPNAGATCAGTWPPSTNITDPAVVEITQFNWTDLGYTETTGDVSQDLHKFQVVIQGRVCIDGPLAGCSEFATRELRNTVRIRNGVFYETPAPAVTP
jgi:prepilin-type N-terminal cleavage/methylation domain-containing protein